jgi:hypothetical protein
MRRIPVALVLTVLVFNACDATPSPVPHSVPTRSSSPSPSVAPTPHWSEISLYNAPGELLLTEDTAWITSAAYLIKVDLRTLKMVGRIDLGNFDSAIPGGGSDVASGSDGVWVTSGVDTSDDPRFPHGSTGGVVLVDPKTNRALRLRLFTDRTPGAVAVHGSSVWVATAGSITRLNRKSLRTTSTTPLHGYVVQLRACCGAIWAAVDDHKDGYIARIDADSGRLVARIPMTGELSDIYATKNSVWAVSGKILHRVDPRTNKIAASAALSFPGSALAVGRGFVWVVASLEGKLMRIDARTLQVVSQQNVDGYSISVAFADDRLWIVSDSPPALRTTSL